MRSILFAAIALAPVMLHAQASTPVLEARLTAPAAPHATLSADHTTTASTPARVSTGYIAPKLIETVGVASDDEWQWRIAGKYRTAIVSLVVDVNGKPSQVKIVRSAGLKLDQNVLAAVGQYRFKPGTVSNQPIESPVDLEINILNPMLQ